MIVFQWSAVAVDGHADTALVLVKRWAWEELSDIGWPAGRVFTNCKNCGAITVEYVFDSMSSFESAWENLLHCERAASLWEELKPLLDEDQVDRQLFSASYARNKTL